MHMPSMFSSTRRFSDTPPDAGYAFSFPRKGTFWLKLISDECALTVIRPSQHLRRGRI